MFLIETFEVLMFYFQQYTDAESVFFFFYDQLCNKGFKRELENRKHDFFSAVFLDIFCV